MQTLFFPRNLVSQWSKLFEAGKHYEIRLYDMRGKAILAQKVDGGQAIPAPLYQFLLDQGDVSVKPLWIKATTL